MKKTILLYSNYIFILIFFFTSCTDFSKHSSTPSNKETCTEFTGIGLTLPYHIIIGKIIDDAQKQAVQEIIFSTFQEIDLYYNKWNPHSEVSRLNSFEKNTPFPLSSELYQLLVLIDPLVALTEGRFDPTVETIQGIWKYCLSRHKIPSLIELSSSEEAVGWNQIGIKDQSVFKNHPGTKLDLGGAAKGYGIDLLAKRISSLGFNDLFVSWGSDMVAYGKHPTNRFWHVAIQNPQHVKIDSLFTLDLSNAALAVSGDYFQHWQVNFSEGPSEFYFHIFDPKTKKPLKIQENSIASAAVIASSCLNADILATAAMIFEDLQTASNWAAVISKKMPEVKFWIMTRYEMAMIEEGKITYQPMPKINKKN